MGFQGQFYRESKGGLYNPKNDNRGSSPLSASSGRGTQGERILTQLVCPLSLSSPFVLSQGLFGWLYHRIGEGSKRGRVFITGIAILV